MQSKINKLQKKFHILKKYGINFVEDPKLYKQSASEPPKNKAVIFSWGKGKIPKDYFMHEMIHIAIGELLEKYSKKKEERFVVDLCRLLYFSKK